MKKGILFFFIIIVFSTAAFAQQCSTCPVPVTGQQQQMQQQPAFVGTAISNSPLVPNKPYRGVAYVKVYSPDFTQTIPVSIWIMGREYEITASIADWGTPNCWSCMFKDYKMAKMNQATGRVEYLTPIPVRLQQYVVDEQGNMVSALLNLR